MSDNSYNGWTNWETWNMALWLDNDESFYNLRRCTNWRNLENMPKFLNETGSVYSRGTPDMNGTDFYRVNWTEILNSWKEEEVYD